MFYTPSSFIFPFYSHCFNNLDSALFGGVDMCQGTSQDSLDCQVTVCHCDICLADKMGHRTYPKVQALHQSSSSPSPWALWDPSLSLRLRLHAPTRYGYSKARAWRDYFQESPLSLVFLWFFSQPRPIHYWNMDATIMIWIKYNSLLELGWSLPSCDHIG